VRCPRCEIVIDTIIDQGGDDVSVKIGKCQKCNRYVIEKWRKVKCLCVDGNIENPHTLLTMEELKD